MPIIIKNYLGTVFLNNEWMLIDVKIVLSQMIIKH
jgi:hypothetical protein